MVVPFGFSFNKRQFRKRIPITCGVAGALGLVFYFQNQEILPALDTALNLTVAVIWYHFFQWLVLRTNDIGWGRWWNLIAAIPVVGLVYIIALMFIPSRRDEKALVST